MPQKSRFKPEITRVKLNPEQAVLQCDCDTVGQRLVGPGMRTAECTPTWYCYGERMRSAEGQYETAGANMSS